MSEAMSTCASCSRKFPTAPPGYVHKCVCGGKMVPDPAPLGMSGDVPAGWVLVPATPTKAMIEAGKEAGMWDDGELTFARHVYESMLAATPTPPIEGRDADVERVASSYAKACDLGTKYHPTEWEKELIEDGIRQYVKALTPTETMINAARKAITDRYYSGGNVVQITPIKPREMAELVLRAALQALRERR